MTSHCHVSVVICAFNREVEVVRAVRSALNQAPAQPQEVIVVDDGSTDRTAAVAEEAGASVIRLRENGGAGRARNVGWKAAKGVWVAFLDSDDEWLPHHLETLLPRLEDRYLFVATSAICQGANAELAGRMFGNPSEAGLEVSSPHRILFPENPIPLSASLVRREALRSLGGFDESLRFSEDFDLWLRMAATGPGHVTSEVTVIYHVHAGQKSGKRASLRSGQDRIVEACAQRSWWTSADHDRRSAVVAWDDLRHGARSRDYRLLFVSVSALARHPRRWSALLCVWRYRLRKRRRSSRWTPLGVPSSMRMSDRISARELVRLVSSPPAKVTAPHPLQRRLANVVGAEAVGVVEHPAASQVSGGR